jgi:hypothetical protein
MKEEWLFPNAIIPVNVETTQALVVEIKRLIDVVGGMALAQRTWVGMTDEEKNSFWKADQMTQKEWDELFSDIEDKLKEKNGC